MWHTRLKRLVQVHGIFWPLDFRVRLLFPLYFALCTKLVQVIRISTALEIFDINYNLWSYLDRNIRLSGYICEFQHHVKHFLPLCGWMVWAACPAAIITGRLESFSLRPNMSVIRLNCCSVICIFNYRNSILSVDLMQNLQRPLWTTDELDFNRGLLQPGLVTRQLDSPVTLTRKKAPLLGCFLLQHSAVYFNVFCSQCPAMCQKVR